jgi:hypothetical protein
LKAATAAGDGCAKRLGARRRRRAARSRRSVRAGRFMGSKMRVQGDGGNASEVTRERIESHGASGVRCVACEEFSKGRSGCEERIIE